MAAKKQAQVIITANASVAERVMQELEGAATRASNRMKALAETGKQIKAAMQQLAAANKQNTDEYKALDQQLKQNNRDFKAAEKEFQAFNSRMRENVKDTKRVQEVMKDLANTATRDLRRALQAAKRELDKMSAKDPRRQQLVSDMKKIQAQIEANTGAIKKQQGMWGALGTTMKNLFAYAGIFAAFNRLKGLMEDIVQKNREMSDQLANIRKVSGLAMQDINQLTRNLAKIDTRSSIQQLNELAYVGSKLGFGNYGIEGLESFVKSAVKVENALKEDLGEDSMMAISKLVEVMGLIPKMGVEKAMDSAGSAIFKLASTSTATGANIIEFSKRLMGLANVSHITTDQLLALGSASDAMGLMPEVSATAFNKVFTSIQSNTKAIEQSLNMQKGELASLINEGKTMEAIVTVFDKMHGMNMDELKSKGVFKALGSDGARLNNVMITMSDRIDMLKTHLKTSNQAFSEGSAVAQEYAIQMETAEAYMQRASNLFTKAFVNPEGVDLTKEFAKAWYDFAKALTQGNGNAIAIQITLKSLLGIMKLFVELLPAIISGFAAWGVWAGGAFLIAQLKQISTLISTIGAGIKAMSLAGLAGIFTGVAVAAYTLFQHFRELNGELEKNLGFMDGFKKDLGELNKQFNASTQELDRYKRAIDQSVQGTKQRAAAIAEFNNKFGGYLKNMLTEKSSAYAIAKAYDAVTKALRAKLALQLKEKDIQNQVVTREAWTAERREEYANTIKNTKYSQYGREWITAFAEENRGKTINDIGKQLAKIFGITNKEVANMIPFLNQSQTQNRNLYTDQQWMVRNALRYIAQDRSARNAKKTVDKKWKPEEDAINEYLASQTPKEEPITPLEERPTKEELAAAKKAQQEEKAALRKDLKDAKEESDAIIAKVEEWYRLQEAVVTGFAADGKWTQEQAEAVNRELEMAKNQALANARLAISGRDTATWERTKEQMRVLMFDMGDWSQELFQQMMDVSMSSIRQNLANIDKGGGQYGITTSSLKDALDKNAAGNLRKVEEIRNKTAKEVEKALLKYNFFDQAVKAFEARLTDLGLLTETAEQAAYRLQQSMGSLKAPERTEEQMTQARTNARQQAGMQFVNGGGRNYGMDINSTADLQSWLTDFTGAQGTLGTNGFEYQFSGWADAFKDEFNKWLQDAEFYKAQIQSFYLSLVDFDTQYYKTVSDYKSKQDELFKGRWEASGKGRAYDTVNQEIDLQSRQQQMAGADQGATFGQLSGFAQIGQDPEVQASLLRMAQMQEELEMYKQVNEAKDMSDAEREAFMQGVHEREMALAESEKAMQESLMANINEQISKMQQWTEPIQQFSMDIGEAFGQTLVSGESMSEGLRNALKSLVQSWGQSTIQIVKDLMMQQLKQKLIGKMMVKQEKQTQGEITQTDEESGKARLNATNIIETGMASVMQTVGQQMLTQKQAQDTQEMSMEGTKTTGKVMAGIAQVAANILGSLGPFAAPLIAVFTALLMGLLSVALGALGGGSKKETASTKATPKLKLVSGMLTYDEGNLNSYVGNDGHVYRAREQKSLPEGVSVIKEPIATTVNGQPSLVAEKGPEIVIGRKTSKRIMMNEPGILHSLMQIERGGRYSGRGYRLFDEGNLGDVMGDMETGRQGVQDERMAAALEQNTSMMQAMMQTIQQLQAKGIPATVAPFGKGSLDEGMRSVQNFRKKYPNG